MVSFWHTILALVWKDVLLEIRTKDIMVSILSFAILSLFAAVGVASAIVADRPAFSRRVHPA